MNVFNEYLNKLYNNCKNKENIKNEQDVLTCFNENCKFGFRYCNKSASKILLKIKANIPNKFIEVDFDSYKNNPKINNNLILPKDVEERRKNKIKVLDFISQNSKNFLIINGKSGVGKTILSLAAIDLLYSEKQVSFPCKYYSIDSLIERYKTIDKFSFINIAKELEELNCIIIDDYNLIYSKYGSDFVPDFKEKFLDIIDKNNKKCIIIINTEYSINFTKREESFIKSGMQIEINSLNLRSLGL